MTWCSQIREQRQEGHFSSPSGKRLCTDNKTNGFFVVNPEWEYLAPPFEHIIFDDATVEERQFVNEDQSIEDIHGTMIGLFLTCFINQRKSITNRPPSSRNDQHLVSPYIIHRLLKHKGYKNGIRAMVTGGKWHTHFKKALQQYSEIQPYDHNNHTITSIFRLSLQPWLSRCARGTPHPTAGRTDLAIVKIDQPEASPQNSVGWLVIGQL